MIIKLRDQLYLNTDTGTTLTADAAKTIVQTAVLRQKNLTISDTTVQITGRDREPIKLQLQDLNGDIEPALGFLITVWLRNSDGSLSRMYKRTIIDPADLKVVRGSFDDYIELETDT